MQSISMDISSSPSDQMDNRKIVMVAIEDKAAEESDVAKDEKRDTEKPLLSEPNTETIELDPDEEKDKDSPTLPLPNRETKFKDDEPPPLVYFPIKRIRYIWNHSESLMQFIVSSICVLFASLGWLIIVGGVPFLSIAKLVMGCLYIDDCPAQPKIPEYLIVDGVFGTVLHIAAVCTKYMPKKYKSRFETRRRQCLCLEAILQIFLIVWFLAGCFWVYTIYEPEYKIQQHSDYCNKVIYLFAFWLFNINFILIILFITFFILIITCVAMVSDTKET